MKLNLKTITAETTAEYVDHDQTREILLTACKAEILALVGTKAKNVNISIDPLCGDYEIYSLNLNAKFDGETSDQEENAIFYKIPLEVTRQDLDISPTGKSFVLVLEDIEEHFAGTVRHENLLSAIEHMVKLFLKATHFKRAEFKRAAKLMHSNYDNIGSDKDQVVQTAIETLDLPNKLDKVVILDDKHNRFSAYNVDTELGFNLEVSGLKTFDNSGDFEKCTTRKVMLITSSDAALFIDTLSNSKRAGYVVMTREYDEFEDTEVAGTTRWFRSNDIEYALDAFYAEVQALKFN